MRSLQEFILDMKIKIQDLENKELQKEILEMKIKMKKIE